MAKTTAQSKKAVDKMSARDRLWDSLDYSYGQKREEVRKQYDRALSQTDNQMLQRGMQRSSYAGQTLANLRQQGADAVVDVYNQQIADYENRLADIEAREQEQSNWERQFAQSQQQIDWNQKFQQGQFDWQKDQAQQQFDYQKGRDSVSDDQWKQSFDYQAKTADQQYAYNQIMQILQAGNTPSKDLLAKAGISMADYKAMMKKQKSSGGGTPKAKDPKDPGDEEKPGTTYDDWLQRFRSWTNPYKSH